MPLHSERLRLRELRESDYELMVGLRNDLATQGWSRTLPPDYTLGMHEKRYGAREFSFRRTDATFIVEEIAGERPVGYCGYADLVDRHSAQIGVALMAEVHGKGYATEINEMLLRLLFHEMGLLKVTLWTHTGNPAAVQAAEHAGFIVASRFREAIFKNGRHFDNLHMDLLRSEYYAARDLTDGLAAT